MEHPGVQMLINRIFKPNSNQNVTDSCSAVTSTSSTTVSKTKAATSVSTTTILEIENRCKTMTTSQPANFSNRFTDFKQQLLSRMKAKRSQMRKEELEEEKIDEEYCEEKNRRDDEDSNSKPSDKEDKEDNADDEDVQQVGEDEDAESSNIESDDDDLFAKKKKEKKRQSKKLMDSDDEDSGETELNSSSGSDKDFKLNLNDDEEEEENEDDESAVDKDSDDHVRVNKKEKKSTSSKSKHKNLMKRAPSSNEITQTNSIPSNQLTKNSQAFNKNFELFMSQESSLLSSNQKRRESLEELNNVSFSIKFEETCGTQNNTNNMSDPNVLEDDENTSKGVEEPEEDELGVFDELAMLCSGQFRKDAKKVNLKEVNDCYNFMDSVETSETIEKHVLVETSTNNANVKEISFENNELYAVDDDEEDDEVQSGTEKKKAKKLGTIVALEDEEESRESGETEDGTSSSSRSKEDGEEDKEEGDEERMQDNDKKKKMRREDFFENEAELSGSEVGSDEDEDGEDSSNSMIFSGDEEQFNDAELKDELAKIYLKDKMDQDKRELRLFKEKYLADGEMRNKDFRRKKFLWKNADGEWNNNNNSSSDEDEDEEEDDDGEKKEFDVKLDAKKFKFAKNGNWRSVRHERELFVRSKSKQENDELLSDENDEENTMNSMSSQSQMSNNGLLGADFGAFGLHGGNQLLKKGQELLKTTQIKRTFEGSFTNNAKLDDDLQPLAQIGSENRALTVKTSDSFVKKAVTSDASPSTLLQKFSFLNRDKTYINRVSNYINKNMVNNELMSGSLKGTTRSSNMVFSSLDLNNENSSMSNNASDSNNENKKKVEKSNSIENDLTASYKSEPKRVKYDTCGSIFNHIS